MTRRGDRLVSEGLVQRCSADVDARGVVVALTDSGLARLGETVPVHLRRVSELFIEPSTIRSSRLSSVPWPK